MSIEAVMLHHCTHGMVKVKDGSASNDVERLEPSAGTCWKTTLEDPLTLVCTELKTLQALSKASLSA